LLDRGLQRAAGRELRHRRRGDRHLLARIARVDALALLAVLGGGLPEAREVDLAAALQCVGDRVEHRVHCLGRVAPRQIGLLGHLVDELLLRHSRSSLPGCQVGITAQDPSRVQLSAQPCGFAALLDSSSSSVGRYRARMRTPTRARASAPPSARTSTETPAPHSARSTTQTAVPTSRPASRSASTASIAAPAEVTTSWKRQTGSPRSYT